MLSSLIPIFQSASALEMREGLWQLEVKQSISGMPADRKPLRVEQCLSPGDPIPTAYLQARRCDVLEREEKYGKLRWRISCFTEHGTIINEGSLRIRSGRMTGRAQSDFGDVQQRHMVIRYQISGVRIGACSDR